MRIIPTDDEDYEDGVLYRQLFGDDDEFYSDGAMRSHIPQQPVDLTKMSRKEKKAYYKNLNRFYSPYSYVPQKPRETKDYSSYDFLKDFCKIHNQYPASAAQPNPFSPRVIFIIDMLNKLGVQYKIDIFNHGTQNDLSWGYQGDAFSHKLVNIIAEPNSNTNNTEPAVLFVAHHDVSNIHSENAQDNSASVCNLLKLASLVKENTDKNSRRVLILFSDCEETGAKGAKRMSGEISDGIKKGATRMANELSSKNKYGEVSEVINLELTGLGEIIWADYSVHNLMESNLVKKLESVCDEAIPHIFCPPNDAPSFRSNTMPALCIGILPSTDITSHKTWGICHSLTDTIDKCSEGDMTKFVETLFKFCGIKSLETDPNQTVLLLSEKNPE